MATGTITLQFNNVMAPLISLCQHPSEPVLKIQLQELSAAMTALLATINAQIAGLP